MVKKVGKKKGKKLTEQEKEQRQQAREVRNSLAKMGFNRVPGIDGKEFVYCGRTTEIDDIFYHENVILIAEYTVGKPGDHLLKKNYFYEKLNENKVEFIKYLLEEKKFITFKEAYESLIRSKYTINQIQIRILYCSRQSISQEHKKLVNDIIFYDYHIVKYFESLSKVIKKSSRYEFFDFLSIPFSVVGDKITASSQCSYDMYSGHILPEEHSSFKEGYKIVSFYIDAESLLKRAYVLRQNGWRKKENIGHYQRMFIPSKIKSMRKYLHEKERVFVNNIIATLSVDKIKLYNEEGKLLTISNDGQFINSKDTKVIPSRIEIHEESNIIGIIDGQHRTFSYHEGDDIYEKTISKFRRIQNLLVTGIIFPKTEPAERRLKFEAGLFMEINATQSSANAHLKQDIELMVNPFSSVSIAKRVLERLNESGPLSNLLEEYWYEKGKLKTASIVSFGLKPLLKLDDQKSNDSLFSVWQNSEKYKLKEKNCEEYGLLTEYIEFVTKEIRELFIAFKMKLGSQLWLVDRNNTNAILTVTTVNGILNALRFIVQNKKISDRHDYEKCLDQISNFKFKDYKSSQYRKMGESIYKQFFINL